MIVIMELIDGKPHIFDTDDASQIGADCPGFRWVHFQGREKFLENAERSGLPASVIDALSAVETRPRCDKLADGVLLNLRSPHAKDDPDKTGDPLVSLRIWATKHHLISVTLRRSSVVRPTIEKFRAGELHDCGDVLVELLGETATQIDEWVASIGDRLDELESAIGNKAGFEERRETTALRSEAISLRRFIVPQRVALDTLQNLNLPWFDANETARIREATDRFYRMGEELESVRERAAVLHDEITDLRAERMDARSLQLAIVALIFLPLTFITGLLGMNVKGIPYADETWAFWGVIGICVAIAAGVAMWFMVEGWSRK